MAMMRMDNIKTRTYAVGDDYLVDIVTTATEHEVWIYKVDYDRKMHMFGFEKEDYTLAEIKSITEQHLESFIETYNHKYLY